MAKPGRRPGFVWRSRIRALAASGLATGLFGAGVLAFPDDTAVRWREAAVDAVLPFLITASDEAIVVVAIDQASLATIGAWPWSRASLAALTDAIAAAEPAVVALDILFAGPDRASAVTRSEAIDDLTAPDLLLVTAFGTVPVVLAALLDAAPVSELDALPRDQASIVLSGPAPALHPWRADGVILPYRPLLEAAAGVGIASLASGAANRVREVPLFATSADRVLPGFALEILRASEKAGGYILDGRASGLRVGARVVPLSERADLRFLPSNRSQWETRSVSAGDVLAGRVDPGRFRGKLVLIGGTAPAQGGLRPTARDPLTPSVQIQADALATMLGGNVPIRPGFAGTLESVAAVVMAVLGAATGLAASPAIMVLVAVALAVAWFIGSLLMLATASWVVDPVTPALVALVATPAAGLVTIVSARQAAMAIRRRFEQHLAPGVVARIVEDPTLLKLAGERREVTALFTDLEGFTSLAERLEPEVLVDLLDRYFSGVTAVVVAHGGMVDKIIGDAVHALFNVPLDQRDHAACAVRCGQAILVFSETFRHRPENAAHDVGRTRIGIETGIAVVGDVGTGAKLDYTAYGSVVNTASRLEALNKTLGTSVCVGPTCRSQAKGIAFRSLGEVEVRGRGALEVFEPIGA